MFDGLNESWGKGIDWAWRNSSKVWEEVGMLVRVETANALQEQEFIMSLLQYITNDKGLNKGWKNPILIAHLESYWYRILTKGTFWIMKARFISFTHLFNALRLIRECGGTQSFCLKYGNVFLFLNLALKVVWGGVEVKNLKVCVVKFGTRAFLCFRVACTSVRTASLRLMS